MAQTVDELKADLRQLHAAINVEESFGVKDVLRYQALLAELERRGYEVTVVEYLNITKRK